jgi:hypothetical protein
MGLLSTMAMTTAWSANVRDASGPAVLWRPLWSEHKKGWLE